MTEIEVIKTDISTKPIGLAEKQELFNLWSKKFNEPVWFFEQLFDNVDLAIQDELIAINPEVLMLKIRKLCTFPAVIPIVLNRPAASTGLTFDQDSDKTKHGGKDKSKKQPQKKQKETPAETKKEVKFQGVATIFQGAQPFIIIDDVAKAPKTPKLPRIPDQYDDLQLETIHISWNETLNVVGFKLLSTERIKQMGIFAGLSSIPSLIKSGAYTVEFLNNLLIQPYLNSVDKLLNQIIELNGGTADYIFINETNASAVLDALLGQMVQTYFNLRSDVSTWYVENLIDLARYNYEDRNKKNTLSSLIEHSITQTINPVSQDHQTIQQHVKFFKLIEPFDNLFQGKLNSKYLSSVWFDFQSMHLSDIVSMLWLKYLGYSVDESKLTNLLKQKELFKKSSDAARSMDDADRIRNYKEMRKRWYFIKRFGFDRFQTIFNQIPNTLANRSVFLDYCTKNEKRIVEIELKRDEKFEAELIDNQEEWVGLVKRMRYEVSKSIKLSLYGKLRKFIKTSDLNRAPKAKTIKSVENSKNGLKEDDYLRSKTDFPIICPHVRDEFELLIDSVAVDVIRDYLIHNYATDETTMEDAYYCRICGESMASSEQIGLTTAFGVEGYNNNEDELLTFVRRQVSWVIGSVVEFSELRSSGDIKTLIEEITNRLYGFIDQIEKRLRKTKTLGESDFENYKRLLTIIYCYALVIRMIIDNPNNVKFNLSSFKFGKKQNVDKLIKFAVEKIMITQNTIIKTMPNVTESYVSNMILKAYDTMVDFVGNIRLNKPEPISLINYILTDPFYWFLVSYKQPSLKNVSANRIDTVLAQSALPENILGKSLNEIMNSNAGIYENVSIGKPNGLSLDLIKKAVQTGDTIFDIFNYIYRARWDSAAMYLLDYTKSGIYRDPYWNVSITKDPNNAIVDTFNIQPNPEYSKFISTHPDKIILQQFEYIWQTYVCMPYSSLYTFHSSRLCPAYNASQQKYIGYEYGPNKINTKNMKILNPDLKQNEIDFHTHEWNYSAHCSISNYDEKLTLDKYDPKQLKIVKKGSTITLSGDFVLIDIYCGICYNSWHDAPSDNISHELELYQDKRAFFNYYSKICPETTGLHDFGKKSFDDGKCLKCNVTANIIQTQNDIYYRKYYKNFQKSLLEDLQFTEPPTLNITNRKSELTGYKFNKNITAEFIEGTWDIMHTGPSSNESNHHKLNWTKNEYTNVITNLGLILDVDFDVIKKGIKTPAKDLTARPDLCIKRRTMLHPAIQTLLIEISRIKNHETLSQNLQSSQLLAILTVANDKDKHLLSQLDCKKLQSDLYKNNYYELSQYLIGNMIPIDQADFTYEYMLTLILSVQKLIKTIKLSAKLQTEIIFHLVIATIKDEEFFSKLKPQKKAEVDALVMSNDPNTVDNDQSRQFDQLVDPDAADKYGYEEMDYEGENEDI